MNVFEQVVAAEDDVFVLRQRSRQIAAAMGFDDADQVRLATALSEIGRDVVGAGVPGTVSFELDDQSLQLVVTVTGLARVDAQRLEGVAAARRLFRTLAVTEVDGREVVRLARPLPHGLGDVELSEVRTAVAEVIVPSAIEELRVQNGELVRALEQLQGRHDEVVALNAELEETNAGVLAMYTQLSEELETTNRGVVALYADLDDKTFRLQQATEAKTRFLNSVSHELRSPVNSVIGLAGLLLDPLGGALQPEQRRQAELISAAGGELLELVNQLLDLARAESGKLQVTVESIDVAAIADEVAEALSPLAREGVVVRRVAVGPAVAVHSDAALVRQILRNLVANAIAFTTTGAVEIRTSTAAEAMVVEVADTGIGIPAEHLDAVFDEFFQIRGALQSTRRGSGLGLPYSRKVAVLLGGSLTVSSEVGAGSTFVLQLPTGTAADEATDLDEVVAVVPGRGRVLVVDDDAGFRLLLTGLLAEVATAVSVAPDGETALEMLRQQHYDLVVLDLVMPGVDGAEVLAQMSDDPALRDIPVIVVTSMNLDGVPITAIGHVRAVLAKQDLDRRRVSRVIAQLAPDDGRVDS